MPAKKVLKKNFPFCIFTALKLANQKLQEYSKVRTIILWNRKRTFSQPIKRI